MRTFGRCLAVLAIGAVLALTGASAHAQTPAPPLPDDLDDVWLDVLRAMASTIPEAMPPFATPSPAAQGQTTLDLADLRANEPLLTDDFEEMSDRWECESGDIITCTYQDGAYVLNAPLSLWGGSTIDDDAADFLYEVDARWSDESEYGFAAGLLFRFTDEDNYYRFEVRANGEYLLIKRVDGESEVLVEATESPLIHTGVDFANRLGVLASGPSITLLIDGTAVQQVEDDALGYGRIGLFVRAPVRECTGLNCTNPTGVAIAYDNLAVWPAAGVPPATGLAPGPAPAPTAAPAAVTLESLNIDWQPLVEEFDVRNVRLEEVLEATMATPVTFAVFEFEAVSDVGLVGYAAVFMNDQGKAKHASAVEFRPDFSDGQNYFDPIGGWKAGMHGTARFALPDDPSKYARIRLVRNQ